MIEEVIMLSGLDLIVTVIFDHADDVDLNKHKKF